MMRTEAVITIVAMAIATFFTRFASFAIFGSAGISQRLKRFLKHVPTAILTALIAPTLFAPQGYIEISTGNSYLIAGTIATLLAYFRQPPLVTMGGGMVAMLAIRSFGI
ncbi:AzlD domain-containing protein [Sporomusa sp. KB1]|jgi:branched-subunit amino acid transport protein|uniref:AzlD domain-containing protein n=1 Tax=Sporomusa sp. KB1 TaxID=943346 RepID=UPI0011ADBFEB|nr:AzlD domain-containing protein [Sporomusa sp. KB1]TWH45857.1 branched-subunit amino acid transport protein [Sporomusa sp. KB1]